METAARRDIVALKDMTDHELRNALEVVRIFKEDAHSGGFDAAVWVHLEEQIEKELNLRWQNSPR